MSPHPSNIHKFPVAAGDVLSFGEEPGLSLLVPKVLLNKVWTQVRQGVRSLSRGGLEVGGFLVGRKVQGGQIVVEDTIPLTIEYRYGPMFRMSPTDLANIAPAIQSAHSDGKRVVLGLYRSRTRGNETIRESDVAILEAIEKVHESYAENFRCCIVLSPESISVAEVGVSFREEGGWSELRSVVLHSNAAATPTAPLEQAPQVAAQQNAAPGPLPVSEAIPIAERTVDANCATPAQAIRKTWTERIAWNAFLGLIIAATLWAVIGPSQAVLNASAPHETAPVHLGFSAMRDGAVWKLSWDRAAIDSLSPAGGLLSITDGVSEQEIPLGRPDLASGLLFYTPQSGNLVFSLRIDSGASHVEEQVRVVLAPPSPSGDKTGASRPTPQPSRSVRDRVQRSSS